MNTDYVFMGKSDGKLILIHKGIPIPLDTLNGKTIKIKWAEPYSLFVEVVEPAVKDLPKLSLAERKYLVRCGSNVDYEVVNAAYFAFETSGLEIYMCIFRRIGESQLYGFSWGKKVGAILDYNSDCIFGNEEDVEKLNKWYPVYEVVTKEKVEYLPKKNQNWWRNEIWPNL